MGYTKQKNTAYPAVIGAGAGGIINLMYKKAIFAIVVIIFSQVNNLEAQVHYVNVMKIAKIESDFNPNAVNPKEGSRGLCQIRRECLTDFNMHHKEGTYSYDQLFDREINLQIAGWYLNDRIPAMLKRFNKPITLENILIAYNAGIKYVAENIVPPKSTLRYIKKYKELGI